MNEMMQAILVVDGEAKIRQVPRPTPTPDQVLIRVAATALNRADLLQVLGMYPPPPGAPDTLGLELAGEVVSGPLPAGTRVMALVGGGGYAEYAAVDASHCMIVHDSFSYEEAAAIPEAFITAHSNLVGYGRLQAGERVLIHAGASGVGLAAIQVAKAMGAEPHATASAGKHEACLAHGAVAVYDYQAPDFAEQVGHDRFDLILDMVGAPYLMMNINALRDGGRLVVIGLQGGASTEVNLALIMRKRITLTGSTLRGRSAQEKTTMISAFWLWAAPLFATGILRPTVYQTFPWQAVQEAHTMMRSNQNIGKIVLTISP
jgi:putative PIG3 family NAD(P)H quinone oxidoreductase